MPALCIRVSACVRVHVCVREGGIPSPGLFISQQLSRWVPREGTHILLHTLTHSHTHTLSHTHTHSHIHTHTHTL